MYHLLQLYKHSAVDEVQQILEKPIFSIGCFHLLISFIQITVYVKIVTFGHKLVDHPTCMTDEKSLTWQITIDVIELIESTI